MDALEHGNTVEETDEAMLALGLPMAPSVLLQMVGPRVANHVLETLHDAYPDRFPLSPTLANYADGNDEIVVVERRAANASTRSRDGRARGDGRRDRATCSTKASSPTAADVDTCLILGAGWPFFLGGITKHLDQTGISERVAGRPLAELGTHGLMSASASARRRTRAMLCRAARRGRTGERDPRKQQHDDVLPTCRKPRPITDDRVGARPRASTAAALRAEDWAGEPFLHPARTREQRARAGDRAPRALDDALAEIEAGSATPSPQWKVRYGLMLGLERVLVDEAAAPRVRHRAAPPPDRRARRDARPS